MTRLIRGLKTMYYTMKYYVPKSELSESSNFSCDCICEKCKLNASCPHG